MQLHGDERVNPTHVRLIEGSWSPHYTEPSMDRSKHWEAIYHSRSPEEVSWYESSPAVSLRWVEEALMDGKDSVIDVGGGASRLIDHLVNLNVSRLAVLDVSEGALDVARERLGDASERVEWIVADVTEVQDLGRFDVWHDRAVFHFLTDPSERARYVSLCERTTSPGGVAIVATFAPDGPATCSGLPVQRYGAADLARVCGPNFELTGSERHVHTTPAGVDQPFVYASFRRVSEDSRLVGSRR
jgi:SAM-dependent methyltransferase